MEAPALLMTAYIRTAITWFKQNKTTALSHAGVLLLYLAYYAYGLWHVPNLAMPCHNSDPFCIEILTEMFKQRDLLLTDMPAYYYSPTYVYFCYFIKLISWGTAEYFKLLVFIQLVIFLISGYFFKVLCAQLFDKRIGRIGFFAYLLYPYFIFTSLLPLKTIFTISLMVFCLYHFVRHLDKRRMINLVAAGALLGILATNRGTALVLIPVFIAAMLLHSNLKNTVIFMLATGSIIVPFFLRNVIIAHDPVLINSTMGLHFYIGNNKNATGSYVVQKDIRPSLFGHYYDGRKYVEKRLAHPVSDSEVNTYWIDKTLIFIKDHPLYALKTYGHKLLLMINKKAISSNYCLYYFKDHYWPFRLLDIPYDFSLIFVAGVMGLIFARIRYKWFFIACAVVLWLSTSLFFITERYKILVIVFLMIGGMGLISFYLEGKRIRLPLLCAMLYVLFLISNMRLESNWETRYLYTKQNEQKEKISSEIFRKRMLMGHDQFELFYRSYRLAYLREFTDQTLLRYDSDK